jgi:hypothetical protein
MAKTGQANYRISLYDGDRANGAAGILCTLLVENLRKFPNRVNIARKMPRPVAVYRTDTGTTATIVFHADHAVVFNDIVGRPSVIVKATNDQVANITKLRMKAGGLLPVGLLARQGRAVVGEILRHKLAVKGLLTHTVTVLQFIALVSTVE